MLRFLPLIAIASVALFSACENDFSPKSEYEERVVVFSVLDRNAAYQVVRLERTFDAESTNPDDAIIPEPIAEAEVAITTSKKRYVFRDTLFTLGDGSQKKIWINREIPVTEGTEYTLTVDVPGFKRVTAVAQVPS
ncbi:MAG: DUF4249 family protein, partial [Bacteroidota bacterium]